MARHHKTIKTKVLKTIDTVTISPGDRVSDIINVLSNISHDARIISIDEEYDIESHGDGYPNGSVTIKFELATEEEGD